MFALSAWRSLPRPWFTDSGLALSGRADRIGDSFATQAGEFIGVSAQRHLSPTILRLANASRASADIREAQRLQDWLLTRWSEPLVSLVDIYHRGPSSIRDAASARRYVTILVDHGRLLPLPGGGEVKGVLRRDVWRIVKTQ